MQKIVIGMDEVGRGALAGPLVVGAFSFAGENSERLVAELCAAMGVPALRDSKKLTRLQRERGAAFLKNVSLSGIGAAEPTEIDALGLTAATRLAAGRALEAFKDSDFVIKADAGLRHPYEKTIQTEWIIKGDEKIVEIACASIVAKVFRDEIMQRYGATYPEYGFGTNVGYGTKAHKEAIQKYGRLSLHRALFLRKL